MTLPSQLRPFGEPRLICRDNVIVPNRWASPSRWAAGPMHVFDEVLSERSWQRPEEGLSLALAAGWVTAPEFTFRPDDPPVWATYQVWRSMVVAAYWQFCGIRVLPLVAFRGCPWLYVHYRSVWAIRGPSPTMQDLADYEEEIRVWAEQARPAHLVVFGEPMPSEWILPFRVTHVIGALR